MILNDGVHADRRILIRGHAQGNADSRRRGLLFRGVAVQVPRRQASEPLRGIVCLGYSNPVNVVATSVKCAKAQLEPDLRSRENITYYKAGHNPPPEHREEVAGFIQRVSAISRKNELHH
jgi:hypothetical protein